MKVKIQKSELDNILQHTIDTVTNLKNDWGNQDDEDMIKKAVNYLEWITLKTELVKNENTFTIPEEKKPFIKRSYVHWIHFGFNIGNEFGGHHPAVILKVTGDSIFVLPLSSGKIPEKKKDKDYCVEIPYVQGLSPIPRWANVYRITCVSVMRIDFTSKIGRLQGKYMNRINEAIEKSGLYRFFHKKY